MPLIGMGLGKVRRGLQAPRPDAVAVSAAMRQDPKLHGIPGLRAIYGVGQAAVSCPKEVMCHAGVYPLGFVSETVFVTHDS